MMTQKEMLSRPDAGYYYRIRCIHELEYDNITLYLIYSAYICELSTVRAIYQQNKHCFD